MSSVGMLVAASLAFVGTHFLLSHPFRAPLVSKLGEKGFAGFYSLVALLTLGWMISAYSDAAAEAPQPYWDAGRWGFALATVLMWLGSVLFMGSLRRNPAFPRPGKPIERIDEPNGVYSITRHPMMWGWGAWGLGMMVMMFLFWALVIAGLVVGIRWLVRQSDEARGGHSADRALQILRERYARGEIGKEEFEARRRDLS